MRKLNTSCWIAYPLTESHFAIVEKIFDGDELTNEQLTIATNDIMQVKWQFVTMEFGPIFTPDGYPQVVPIGWQPDYNSSWLYIGENGELKLSPFAQETVELWRSFLRLENDT